MYIYKNIYDSTAIPMHLSISIYLCVHLSMCVCIFEEDYKYANTGNKSFENKMV
jgi:hypothetical protein